ncbi:UNVERIFIED_CONTAM: hypothetical protein NCL1_42313 [Trichonephila clavipes]
MIEKSNTIYSPNVYHSSHLQVPVLGPPPVSQPPNNLTPCQNNPTAPTNLMVINSSPIVPTLPAVNAEANISSSKEAVHSTLYAGVQNSACVSGPTSFPTSALFTPYVASQVPYAVNPNNGYYAQQQVTISVSEQFLPLCPVERAVSSPYGLALYRLFQLINTVNRATSRNSSLAENRFLTPTFIVTITFLQQCRQIKIGAKNWLFNVFN